MPDPFAAVREHLRAARARKGWTQERLAEEADVPVDLIVDLENRRKAVTVPGSRRSPEDWRKVSGVFEALGEDAATVLRAKGLL